LPTQVPELSLLVVDSCLSMVGSATTRIAVSVFSAAPVHTVGLAVLGLEGKMTVVREKRKLEAEMLALDSVMSVSAVAHLTAGA
jgi:hypothetical protein